MALYNYRVARVFEVPGPLHLEHSVFRKADLWTAQRKKDFGFRLVNGHLINIRHVG